ncbi:Uncharacterized protein HZ326_31819 [Fusarium oxysporum f. sp. albedinis]|nr:Uncharacterized protein HZ326_31819 [Fusarium oxysporum f. sp. albedinis]
MSQPSDESRILLALQALQNNPKLTARRAAEIYQVGRMKLWRRHKDMTIRGPNAKIQLLFVAGLGLYRIQSQSMVSD